MIDGKQLTCITLSVIVVVLTVSVPNQSVVAPCFTLSDSIKDLTGIEVAVYYATSLEVVNASRIAMVKMYEWMGANVTIVNAAQVKNGCLSDFEIFAVPGANPITMHQDLGLEGRAKVREWVYYGGSYFGICGGAMLASRKTNYGGATTYYLMKLWNGTVRGPLDIDGMTTININRSCDAPDLSDESYSLSSNYQGGGYYEPDEGQNMTTLATYEFNDKTTIMSTTFGTGAVCLSASHVEYEENSDRDGTDLFDSLSDPDSEWPLMKTISCWQIETSVWVEPPAPVTTTETTTTTTTTTETTTETSTTIEETTTDSTSTSSTTTSDITNDNPGELMDPLLAGLLPVIAVSGVVVVIMALVAVKRR